MSTVFKELIHHVRWFVLLCAYTDNNGMSAIGPTYPKMLIVMVCTYKHTIHKNDKICVHRQLWFVCFGPACLIRYSYCKPQVCMASMHKHLWYVWIGPAFYVSYKIIGPIIGIIHLHWLVISKSGNPWYTVSMSHSQWYHTQKLWYILHLNYDMCELDPPSMSVTRL